MNAWELRPDALLIGAPKAGTSALHVALARHSQVHASPVKEPKYFLCGDAPPPAYCGPGDAHSRQEWIWRRADYVSLFSAAPTGSVRLESTPFYLYQADARRRIAEDLPDVKLVAIIRDPVDRAYSNWMHLWVDGLEPESDFCAAWRSEDSRVDAGWAPIWHYRRMGRYGEQLADLFDRVERDRVLVLRYRELVSEPARTLDQVATFLGVTTGQVSAVPADNSRPYVEPGLKASLLGRVVRAGAVAGSHVRPEVWRQAVKPLYRALQYGGPERRPKLAPEVRAELVKDCLDDIGLLEDVLNESFDDWRSSSGRGSFKERAKPAT